MLSKAALLLCVACSSGPDTGTQHEAWFDTCKTDNYPVVSDTDCYTIHHFTCKDGDSWWFTQEAIGSEGLNTECYREESSVYLYVCVVDQNTAEVRCSH